MLFRSFVEGAKDGFQTAVGIIPYLVAMLVAVGALRASGVMDMLLNAIKSGVSSLAIDTRWVDAMPTALIKPLSGGGARGMMVETMKTLGADSFAGRLSCVIQGSTEMRLNYETRLVQVAGVIRPTDIDRLNQINYDRIAEARFAYGGDRKSTRLNSSH